MTSIIGKTIPGVPESIPMAPWAVATVTILGWIATGIWFALSHKKLTQEVRNLETERDRIRAERDKLLAEAIVSTGTTLERKQTSRNAHRDACISAKKATMKLLSMIRSNDANVSHQRDTLCAVISDQVIHTFHGYCEWTKLELKHAPNEMEEFILKVVCPELDRIAEWIAICNHDRFVKDSQLARLSISGSTMHIYGQLCSDLPEPRRNDVRRFVTRSIESVLKA